MGQRHSMTAVAATATLLATLPLASIFSSFGWFGNGLLAVAVVAGSATAARMMRAPAGLQVIAMLAALLLFLTWRFPSGEEIAGLIPTGATFAHFNELLNLSGQQIREQAIPVPDLDGLLMLSTMGIGLMAILVDLAAVGLRRPALAGLPMLALYSVPVAVLPNSASFLTFAAACIGYLWLLVSDSVDRVRRFGRRFSGEGRDVDRWEPSPLSAAGRRLGVFTIIAAILLPLAIPVMTPTLLSQFGPPGGSGNGGGNSGPGPVSSVNMDAFLHDNLTQTEVFDMVTVHTTDPAPYYLRLFTGERVDADGFHADIPADGGVPIDQELPDRTPAGPVSVAGTYRAQIEVTGLSQAFAPIYSQVTSVSGLDGTWTLDPSREEIYSTSRNVYGARYAIEYQRLAFSPDALRTASDIPLSDDELQALTRVPHSAYAASIVRDETRGLTNEYDRVRALYEYFKPTNGFRYSLSTVEGNSGSAIEDFLRNKRGFCEQYAAALAWLVREAGYPARVAVGFTRGTGRNGVYALTNFNLHAWTEVYFPNFGWVPFDATPGSAVQGSTRTEWAPAIEDETSGPGTTPTPGATGAPLPNEGPDGQDPSVNSGGGHDRAFPVNIWYVVAGAAVVALLALLAAPSLQRRARRRRRLAQSGGLIALNPAPPGQEDLVTDPAAMSSAQRDAHAAWAELLDTMIDYGVLIDATETPLETANRLAGAPELAPTGRPPTTLLARAEERARYAPAPVRPVNLDQAIREAREAFADNATRWQQLSAAVFPRSVLLQWRLRWYGFLTGTTRRAARVRDAVLLVPLRERRHGRR